MARKPKVIHVPAAFNIASLTAIAVATRAGSFYYIGLPDGPVMQALGLIEVNPAVHDGEGGVASKITEAGEAYLAQHGAAPVVAVNPAPVAAAPSFAVMDGFSIPETARGRTGVPSKYPFETISVGQFFFIPNTAEKPDAVESYASTASSANVRLSPKRFKIAPWVIKNEDGTEIKGAAIGRIADYTPEELVEAQKRSAQRSAARAATKAKTEAAEAAKKAAEAAKTHPTAWGHPSPAE